MVSDITNQVLTVAEILNKEVRFYKTSNVGIPCKPKCITVYSLGDLVATRVGDDFNREYLSVICRYNRSIVALYV